MPKSTNESRRITSPGPVQGTMNQWKPNNKSSHHINTVLTAIVPSESWSASFLRVSDVRLVHSIWQAECLSWCQTGKSHSHYTDSPNITTAVFRICSIMHNAHTGNTDVLRQPVKKCVADELCKEKTQRKFNNTLQHNISYMLYSTDCRHNCAIIYWKTLHCCTSIHHPFIGN